MYPELNNRKKFKAVITNMNIMCNPTLFPINQELWAPYHNFSVYSCWYSEGLYEWAYRRIPTNMCLPYQLLVSYSTVISKLTQRNIEFHESVVSCQHITWDENISILYFKHMIMNAYIVHRDTRNTTTFPGW